MRDVNWAFNMRLTITGFTVIWLIFACGQPANLDLHPFRPQYIVDIGEPFSIELSLSASAPMSLQLYADAHNTFELSSNTHKLLGRPSFPLRERKGALSTVKLFPNQPHVFTIKGKTMP